MGLNIKRNDEGLYKLTSTISDESYHPNKEWIDENEVKKLLIHKVLHQFIEKAIEIDMSFPVGYMVNDTYQVDDTKPCFNRWFLDALKSDDIDDIINNKFIEIYNKLNLDFKIP